MATKIRRCLYIGLGGTGMTSLLHTKKMFTDTYGTPPPMIGFLGIDTDGGAYKRELESKTGEKVRLKESEQFPIQVEDALPIYEINKERFMWLPEENLGALTSMKLGAGQVRSNGRFALTVNYDKLKNKVISSLNEISKAEFAQSADYELLGGADPEIHMVFSLAGGTGCGTFLNMAYLIKEVAPKCKLIGYGVLPDVFEAMSQTTMAKVKPNAFGAIQDLDWLMHLNIGKEPFELKYLKTEQAVKVRPFNSFVFIDNKNRDGDTYDHVDKLAEMVSLALVTSAGALSAANASVNDNLEKIIREGDMNVENKLAWAAGMGASEIVFRGEDLSRIYQIKASNYIIENLLNTCTDTDSIVNNWIDSPEVNIRENNGFDNLTDYLLAKQPKFPMTQINDSETALAETLSYVESVMPKDEELQAKCVEKQNAVRDEFHKLITEQINRQCGVGTVEKVILGLESQIDIMLGEMRSERDALTDKAPRLEQGLKAVVNDLTEYGRKFFKTKSKEEEKQNEAMTAALQLAICRREIKRRETAIQFYTFMKNLLMEESNHTTDIRKKLEGVYQDNTHKLAQIQNRVGGDNQMFQIDLAQSYVTSITIIPEEININDYVNGLGWTEQIYDTAARTNDEVANSLMAYTAKLNGAKSWAEMTIDKVLDKMSDEQFAQVANLAIKKSMPLFNYNYQGFAPVREPVDIYYLGVPSKNCRFNKAYLQAHSQGGAEVDESVIGMKDRIILYRQVGLVPAYSISSVPTFKSKYDQCRTNCHIDRQLQLRMVREDYDLEPKRATDNSVEMWVKGFIFGLIKKQDGFYFYYDPENGDPLEDYWRKLADYRDKAFEEFRRNLRAVTKQFEEFFDTLQKEKGTDYLKAKVAQAKEGTYYRDNISQIDMTNEELNRHGNEDIRRLVTDEINFVKKEL